MKKTKIEEIFRIDTRYFDLSVEKKRNILDIIIMWAVNELAKLDKLDIKNNYNIQIIKNLYSPRKTEKLERNKMILEYYNSGMSGQKIANKLGISRQRIYEILRKFN
ncbi:helix-turn-helix domain-containing protein [bacterium]|nr:helix-turn-helix domain-containing protein [bacterium]